LGDGTAIRGTEKVISFLLRLGIAKRGDHPGESLPIGHVSGKLFAAALGNRNKKLGFAVVVRRAHRRDPAALLEADKRRVDGALIEKDGVAADLLDAASDAVAVLRAESGQGLEDHKVKSALEKVEFFCSGGAILCHSCGITTARYQYSCANATGNVLPSHR